MREGKLENIYFFTLFPLIISYCCFFFLSDKGTKCFSVYFKKKVKRIKKITELSKAEAEVTFRRQAQEEVGKNKMKVN